MRRGARNVLGSPGAWGALAGVRLTTLVLAGAAGCFVPGTADPPPATTPTPVAVVMTPAPEPVAQSGQIEGPGGQCGATLWVQEMRRSSAGCTVDEVVTRTPGTLRFPCAGGEAEALFGATSRFVGAVQNGIVDVKISTDFPFSDGCQWRSLQLIQGNLASGQLQFTYREAPIEGQSGCASPCTAEAVVRAQ